MNDKKKVIECEIFERPKEMPVSKTLAQHLESSQPQVFYRVKKRLTRETSELSSVPKGKIRARIAHDRVSKALDVELTKHPKFKASISCFNCTQSGCCHTNVDITESEAELLADRVPAENMERLIKQAAVHDTDKTPDNQNRNDEKYFSEWKKLSFEDRACPFLVEGRCSVYEDRPSVCRKWLVTTDPKLCADIEHTGRIAIVETAEVISSVAFSIERSGRLARMILEQKERQKK